MRTTIATALMLLTASAAAQDSPPATLEEMWQRMQAQQQEIEALRRENAVMRQKMDRMNQGLSEVIVKADSSAGMVVEKEPRTGLEVYGFAQLDFIHDFDRVDPDWNDASRPSKIPVQDTAVFGDDGETIVSARQSRIGFRSDSDLAGDKLKVWLEWDLYAAGNDAGELELNTRHAWGEWRNYGGGQTWTNFMDISIFPNTIDYWGPPGMIFVRKPQVRYTDTFRDNFTWAITLEDPGSDVDAGILRDVDPGLAGALNPKNTYPDLALSWRGDFDWGHYRIAGIGRFLEVETLSDGAGSNPGNDPSEDTYGWGVNFTSVITTTGRDQLKLGLVYGEGIASYFNDGGSATALDEDADLEAVESLGISVWYDHYWNDRWSTSVGWGMHEQDNTELQEGDAFNTGQLAQINLLYSQGKFLTGLEAIWMEREDNNGEDNDSFRLQYSMKYSFDKNL